MALQGTLQTAARSRAYDVPLRSTMQHLILRDQHRQCAAAAACQFRRCRSRDHAVQYWQDVRQQRGRCSKVMTAVAVVSAAATMQVRATTSRMAAAREAWRPIAAAKCCSARTSNRTNSLLGYAKVVHPFLTVDRVRMIPPQHALPACEALAQQRCGCLALVHVSQERRKIQHGREGVRVARP